MKVGASSWATSRQAQAWGGAVIATVTLCCVPGVSAQSAASAAEGATYAAISSPPPIHAWPAWLFTPAERRAIELRRAAAPNEAGVSTATVDILQYWRLDGVVQVSGRSARSAWINGELWEAGANLAPDWVIVSVSVDRVILRNKGRTVSLAVGDTVSSLGVVTPDAVLAGLRRARETRVEK